MGGLGQSQAGEQCEQAAVGDSARVVGRRGFAAKRKRHGLRTGAARQCVNAPPGGPQAQHQQQGEGNARRKNGRQQALRDLQGPGAQPVGQQTVRFRRQGAQQGREPRCMPARQFQHVAISSDIGPAPGVAADETRQHVGRAQKQQSPARQGPHGAVGNDGGSGLVHAKSGCRVAVKHTGKKKQRGFPGCLWTGARALALGQGAFEGLPACPQTLTWPSSSCRNGCGSARRAHPYCRPTFAYRCRRGVIRWTYRA